MRERAILVTLKTDSMSAPDALEVSAELGELARSAGLSVMQSLVLGQKAPSASILMGSGKAQNLRRMVNGEKANVVVFESGLTNSQQRNLEEILDVKTIDRTQLILDIFAQRARSMEGKLQVELAQLKYLLPRLSGKGIALSRLGGGVGTRGPGEQKLEMDRRRIRERIARLARELRRLHERRLAGIARKKEKELPLVALVGYTNAGKSSLFNRLTESSVPVENRLFSTLDTTTRHLPLPGNAQALLVDTVGFISRLPHDLVESFKATLEETLHADLLLHVMDGSRPDLLSRRQAVVRQVLTELGAGDKTTFLVLNKVDLLDASGKKTLSRFSGLGGALFVSAKTGEGLDELASVIRERLAGRQHSKTFFIPKEQLGLAHFLYEHAEILSREDGPDGSFITAHLSEKNQRLFQKRLGNFQA